MRLALALILLMFSGHTSPVVALCAYHCGGDSVAQAWQAAPDRGLARHNWARPETSLADPSVGIGLAGVTDYATQLPFLNVMKTARVWSAHIDGEWGGVRYQELLEGGYLDEDGWPRAMPPGVTGIATLVLTDLPREAVAANGRYRFRYDGHGLVEISSGGRTVTGRDGEAWFTAAAGEGSVIITILRTDPEGTGEYLRNFTIVKEENIPAFEAGQVFNPVWIDHIKDMRVLRFMDWMMTNDSLEAEWDNRPKVDDFTYTDHGVPLEIMIRLANEVGADPWFNIPHLATDDYIRQFATTVHGTLDPRLKTHVELSNEVWNWQFGQSEWAEQNGRARWGKENSWVQFYAVRASQMAVIWDKVYGADANNRLLKIISTQTGWEGLEEDILTAPLWMDESPGNRPPYTYFDAYAVTGYFGGRLGDDKAPIVLAWLDESLKKAELEAEGLTAENRAQYVADHRYDFAVGLAGQELRDGGITGEDQDTVHTLITETFPYQAAVAKKYGLDLIMYEGGPSVAGFGEWGDNDRLTAFFNVFSYSPEVGVLQGEVLEGWKAAGGTLFNVFVDVYPPNKWGSWGALRYLDDDNPRWDAIKGFNAANQAWWETRSPRTFN